MANGNKTKYISIVITLFLILVTGIGSFVWVQADVKAVNVKVDEKAEHIKTLKKDGCDPARANSTAVQLSNKDIQTLQETVNEIKVQQTAGFKEILKRLPDK